jgi:hypothetical protein
MRTYIVQAGDSPASIASQDQHASCPKCAIDLIRANAPPKEVVTFPNGFLSFKELRVGEELKLPDKWFDPAFELLPPAYFASLPYADGVTPSPFGKMAPIILRDFKALDVAAAMMRALANVDDQAFAKRIVDVAEAIDTAAQPAIGRSQYAQAAHDAVRLAAQNSRVFLPFLAAGLSTEGARRDVQNALASALDSAQHAICEMYGAVQPPSGGHP